jgi:hypothetical protein
MKMVRFQVLTAVSTKMDVFWVVAPCSPVEVYRLSRGACCLHHQGPLPSNKTQSFNSASVKALYRVLTWSY